MKKFLLLVVFVIALFAKSAIVYYGEELNFSKLKNFDYIITQEYNTNPMNPLFKKYRNKIYIYVSIGEIYNPKNIPQNWIKSENKNWHTAVLDITNKDYQNYLLNKLAKLRKKGFKNFFFDTLDSYYLYSKTPLQIEKARNALANFINRVHQKFPNSKIVVNRGFDIIDKTNNSINAVLFESYYRGLGGPTGYKKVSENDRKWLDSKLEKFKNYNKDIICVDYLPLNKINSSIGEKDIKMLKKRGFIPYISTRNLSIYGKSE
ncbi:MAG: hypothetical protein DSY40_03880 [Nautilia sp.]|nr:MAG: hypothetical protein DSY40_03880 [Nautilia sp.]